MPCDLETPVTGTGVMCVTGTIGCIDAMRYRYHYTPVTVVFPHLLHFFTGSINWYRCNRLPVSGMEAMCYRYQFEAMCYRRQSIPVLMSCVPVTRTNSINGADPYF